MTGNSEVVRNCCQQGNALIDGALHDGKRIGPEKRRRVWEPTEPSPLRQSSGFQSPCRLYRTNPAV
jgi:hypothetical protein